MGLPDDVAEKHPMIAAVFNSAIQRKDKPLFWDDMMIQELKFVEASPNKIVWELKIREEYCNLRGNAHGGFIATLIDLCSSTAMSCFEGKNKSQSFGVSVELSVNYMRGVNAGQTVRIESEVLRMGKNLCKLYTKIYDEAGNLCYTGSHTKFQNNRSSL